MTAGSSVRAARESRAWIGASASVKSLRTISRRFSTISIPAAFIRARTSSRVTASSSVTFLVQQRDRAGRVRRVHRRRRVEVRGVERREPVHAEEPHRDLDLVLEQLEHADQTGLARRGEPAAREAPDADTLRAERQGLDDVSAAHEAAVHDDRRPAADRPDDLEERLDRAPAVVELAPAVVGDVHALDAVVGRKRRVLGRRDALQDERDRVRVLEALDVVPAEPRLELEAAGARPPGLHEAPGEIALAPAVARGVHGEAEGRVAVVHGAPHPVVHPRVVATDVELEDAEVVRRGRDRLEPGVADGAEHLGTPNSSDAFAAVAPPPSAKVSIEPIGASNTGMRTGLPKKVEVVSILETSRRTRGRNAIESSARRLRRTVVSGSAPPIR